MRIFIAKFFSVTLPILIIVSYFFLSLITIHRLHGSFTTIQIKHNEKLIIPKTPNLVNGITLQGEVKASYNNLGTIALPLQTNQWLEPKDEKKFIFRIKEQGANTWLTVNEYKSNTFYKMGDFPFGIIKQKDSAGKKYLFELTSEKGFHKAPLVFNSRNQYIVTKYQFSKLEIFTSPQGASNFLVNKIINSLFFDEIRYAIILYAVFPVLYFLSLIKKGYTVRVMYFVFLVSSVCYVLFFPVKNDFLFALLIISWIYMNYWKVTDSKVTFINSLLFLICMFVFLLLKLHDQSEKAGELAYAFFVVGVLQELSVYYMNKLKK